MREGKDALVPETTVNTELTLEHKNVRTLKLIVALCDAEDAGVTEDWWTDLAVTATDALDVLEGLGVDSSWRKNSDGVARRMKW